MRLSKRDSGRWCTVKFDDIGRVDGLIVQINTEFKSADVYIAASNSIEDVEFNQIVELRDYVNPA